ncbi:MAG: ABC transporter permease, partial [Gemmatimonadaceae bacterium]
PPAAVGNAKAVRRLYVTPGWWRTAQVSPYFSYARIRAVRARASDDTIAGYTPSQRVFIRSKAVADSALLSYADPSYFSVLGLRPRAGRFFAADEGRVDVATPVVVISDAFWRRAFDADPDVLGRQIVTGERTLTVIGVAPRGFTGIDLDATDLWVPPNCWPSDAFGRTPWYRVWGNYFLVVTRTRDAAAESHLLAVGTAALRNNPPDAMPDSAITLSDGPIIAARGPSANGAEIDLTTRVAAVALIVLLVASANAGNMLLLRASSRRREIGVRRALGVSTGRLSEQMIVESVVVALASAVVASVIAQWVGAVLRILLLPEIHWPSAVFDARVAEVTAVATVIIGVVAGLLPAALAARVDMGESLRSGGARLPSRARAQDALLVAQTAFSVVLVVAAGLFVRSLDNILSIDLGYRRDGLLTASVYVRPTDARASLVQAGLANLVERARTWPGVSHAALAMNAPMTGYMTVPVFEPGRDSAVVIGGAAPTSLRVGPGYFATSGIRLLAGRDFTAADASGGARVMVVGKAIADGLWPGESPLGKCLAVDSLRAGCTTVIGVVEDAHRMHVIESVVGQYYLPLAQSLAYGAHSLSIRVAPSGLGAARRALEADLMRLTGSRARFDVRTLDELLDRDLRPWRVGAVLFSALGLLALVVAATGTYGVVAYRMSQRTHEMGVRVALGARRSDIVDLVVGSGLRLVPVGVMAGMVVVLWLGKLISAALFGVTPSDPSVLIAAIVAMVLVSLAASLIPAWRAARVDPVTSLRAE